MRSPDAPDQAEAAHRRRFEDGFVDRLTDIYLVVGLFMAFGLVVNGIFAAQPLRAMLVATGLTVAVAAGVVKFSRRRWPHFNTWFVAATEIAVVGFLSYRFREDLLANNLGTLTSAFAVMLTGPLTLLLSPNPFRTRPWMGAVFLALGTFSIWEHASHAMGWIGCYSVALVIGAQYSLIFRRTIREAAESEVRALVAIAPAPIVRKSLLTGLPPAELFKAQTRPCICISSDWRGYQELSRGMSPQELAEALEDYYTMVEEVLTDAAPAGNYHCDWIADELFVVFFATEASEEATLAAQALGFARALLGAKAAFVGDHPAPRGIDIGVAFGEALVGLLGVTGLNKATAVGEAPAKARVLQVIAKGLREPYGARDRIVVNAALAQGDGRFRSVPKELGPAAFGEALFYEEAA